MLERYIQPDGSLQGAGAPYIKWHPGAPLVEIDGHLTPQELIELARYIAEKEGLLFGKKHHSPPLPGDRPILAGRDLEEGVLALYFSGAASRLLLPSPEGSRR